MKKILAAFDGLRFSDSTLSYALSLAGRENAKLFGLFLEDPYLHGYGLEDLIKSPDGSLSRERRKLDKQDVKTRALSVKKFEQSCREAGVAFAVRKQHRFALNELIYETGYADLLVISSHEAMKPYRQKEPVEFIHGLLPEIKCPVLIVPAAASPVTKTVLLYDGKDESRLALRTYCNVLGGDFTEQANIVSVYTSRSRAKLEGGTFLKEYLSLHFKNYKIISLEGKAAPVLEKYLFKEDPGTLVVMGAYKRTRLTRWLRASLADRLMNKLELPLFISHI
jgi:nucleotide-binding universal stress UspA family protein